uniref:Cytochrome C oxidase subunit IV n=1 Tax=Rhodopseudomonas palustris (strain BisA53) TaxID=316055 RepID=Q07U03_RHOP5
MKLAGLNRRDVAVVVLLGLTAIGLALSRSEIDPTLCSVTLLGVAAFKARLVVLDYFGLRGTPGPWRAILTTWIVVLALASAASAIMPSMSWVLR